MKYAKLHLWRTFNLNKTQSLNDALRAVYTEEEGGISWPLRVGSETNPNSCFPTHTDSENMIKQSEYCEYKMKALLIKMGSEINPISCY